MLRDALKPFMLFPFELEFPLDPFELLFLSLELDDGYSMLMRP
jgi:hypothetical protein